LSKRIQVLAWTGWRLNRRSGKPIGSIRKAWQTATEKATIPWLRPHDLRRSAARNLLRSGEDSRQREVATETPKTFRTWKASRRRCLEMVRPPRIELGTP
jgi:integrase